MLKLFYVYFDCYLYFYCCYCYYYYYYFILFLNMNNMYYKEKRSNRVPRRTASEEEVSKFNRDYGYYIYLWYMYRG